METASAEKFPGENSTSFVQQEPHNILPKSSKFNLRPERKPIPTSAMVKEAIQSQMTARRRGVSLMAIKNYIWQNYQTGDVDIARRMRYIKSYIVRALDNGNLLRTTGTSGLSGSFRLPVRYQRTQRTIKKTKKKKVTIRKLKVVKKHIRNRIKKSKTSMRLKKQKQVKNKKSSQTTKKRRTTDLNFLFMPVRS